MKALRALLVLAALLLAPVWLLLGTTGGLRFAAAIAERITGGHLTIGGVDGRLIDDIAVTDLAWTTDTVRVEIDRAVVNLRLSRLLMGRIQAEDLAVGVLTVRQVATPPPKEHEPLTVRMPLRLAVEQGRLAAFELWLAGWQKPWRARDATFGAHWRGEWIVIGALRVTTSESGPAEVHGRIAIVDDLLQLEDVEISGPGQLRVKGAIAIADEASNGLEVAWDNLVLPNDWAPWFSSRRGEGRFEGPWRNFGWHSKGHVHVQGIPGELAARGRGNLKSITVQHFDLATLDGAVRGDGRVDWSPRLTTQATVQLERINPASAWPEWPGVLNGAARLKATWGGATQLEFDGDLRDSKLRDYPFALHATGRTEDRKVFLREFALQSGGSKLTARGQLLPEMALAGELHSDDLRSVWAGLSGRVDLRATASGTFAEPRLTAKGTLDDIVYRRYRVDHGDLDALFAPRASSRIDLQLAGLDVGAPLKTLRVEGAGTRAAHTLRIAAEGRDSWVRLGFKGRERDGAWRGQLVEAGVQPPKGVAWTLEEPAALAFARNRFESEPACLAAGASRACAQLALSPGRQHIAFRARDFDLQHLRVWLPAEWNLTGAVTGSAAFTLEGGELTAIRADLAATAGFIEGAGVRLDFQPGTLDIDTVDSRLHALLKLRPAGGTIDADVWVAPGRDLLDRPMLGDLTLKLPDLAWLPVLSPEIAAAQGALGANLHVSGTPRSPSLDGKVHLTDGRVQLTTPGIELTGITASFERGEGAAPMLLHAQATSGDGSFQVDGEFKALQPKLIGELAIKGENVLGFNRPDIKAWLSPDLKLALDGTRARLSGQIGVPRAQITPRELASGGVGPSPDQVIVETEEVDAAGQARGVRIESEVTIALGDDVKFDGLGLRTRLAGAITAYDDPERPTRGRGELRLEGGRYKAYGQELQIEKGRLIFGGGPITDPAIDITAIRKPREDIKVGLRARGTLDAPEFSLFSEPAMAQEEQLSWLVLGRSLSATLDSGQRTQLSSAAMSLGFTGGEYLAQQLAPRLGVDEVTLGARPGETTDLARFTIGKYLSPKLFVSYGYGIFQPGHFFRMQYDLSKRFKLVGESGVQQGGDILYTIER